MKTVISATGCLVESFRCTLPHSSQLQWHHHTTAMHCISGSSSYSLSASLNLLWNLTQVHSGFVLIMSLPCSSCSCQINDWVHDVKRDDASTKPTTHQSISLTSKGFSLTGQTLLSMVAFFCSCLVVSAGIFFLSSEREAMLSARQGYMCEWRLRTPHHTFDC